MAALDDQVVGFECEFVEEPPKYLQSECPVCLQILREPYQVTCCGKSFCRECIKRAKLKSRPCPCCKQDDFNHFPNKGLQQPLYGFQVHCVNKDEGCEWKGELGELDNHLNLKNLAVDNELQGCAFANIKCGYCCETLTRKDLQHHKNELCDKRPFSCEYCNKYESTYDDVIHNHWPVCGSHPVKCPNKCGIFFHRLDLEGHVKNDCPLSVVECDFSYAGCDVKLARKDMPEHVNESLATHFSLLATSHKKQQEMIKVLTDELSALNRHMVDIQSHTSVVPVDFIIENPLTYTAFKVWSSSHFYSHCRGYKLKLRFTKVSAYFIGVYLVQGEFDGMLEWPFKAVLVVHIINHEGEAFELHIKVEGGKRVRDGDGIEICGRVAISNISQYIYSDCLHIRIVDVQF